MALTDVQQSHYARPNRGFERSLPGVNMNALSEDDYAALWDKSFGDYLKEKGVPDAETAKSDKRAIDHIEALFGAIAYRFGDKNLYDFVVERLYNRTIGDILTEKDEILRGFRKELQEMNDDYLESGGSKARRFLSATHYNMDRDGRDEDYFYRYWRAPLTKVLAYRHIDVATPEGEKTARQMVEELFGTIGYSKFEDLIRETPEHLVEKRDDIEAEQRRKAHEEETERERLMDQPFSETLERFAGVMFSDKTNPDQMAADAFAHPAARDRLKALLRVHEPDELDLDTFTDAIRLTPRQIEFKAADFRNALQDRNDNQYLLSHPEATFEQFMKDRRKDTTDFSRDGLTPEQKALQKILQTTERVDNRLVEESRGKKCADLAADADNLLSDMRKRRRKRWLTTASVLTSFLILSGLGIAEICRATANGISNLGKKTAPIVQQATQKTKEAFQKKEQPQPTVTNTDSDTIQQTNILAAAETPVKTPMVLKGNRPILGRWHAFRDEHCHYPDPNAFQRFLVGEFNDIMHRIQENGIPFAQQFDPARTSRMILREHNKIMPEVTKGQEAIPFYFHKGGADYDEFMSDTLNFHMNIGDVLNNLPVAPERLADAQFAAGEAIGPAMGWSIGQQIRMQSRDKAGSELAYQTITANADAMIKQQKADTNDVETVFWAVMAATRDYRKVHPENNYLLLVADKSMRHIAGIEMANTQQYAQLSPADRKEAAAYIEKADEETRRAYEQMAGIPYRDPKQPREKRSWPLGWVIFGTAALTIYLTAPYFKKKGKIY